MTTVTNGRNDLPYYYRRHEQCKKLAESASHPMIAQIHIEFAEHYAAMIFEIEAIGAPLKTKLAEVQ